MSTSKNNSVLRSQRSKRNYISGFCKKETVSHMHLQCDPTCRTGEQQSAGGITKTAIKRMFGIQTAAHRAPQTGCQFPVNNGVYQMSQRRPSLTPTCSQTCCQMSFLPLSRIKFGNMSRLRRRV